MVVLGELLQQPLRNVERPRTSPHEPRHGGCRQLWLGVSFLGNAPGVPLPPPKWVVSSWFNCTATQNGVASKRDTPRIQHCPYGIPELIHPWLTLIRGLPLFMGIQTTFGGQQFLRLFCLCGGINSLHRQDA